MRLCSSYEKLKEDLQSIVNTPFVAAERRIEELLDPKKVTYMLMLESGGAYS